MTHVEAFRLLRHMAPAIEAEAVSRGVSPETARELADWIRTQGPRETCMAVARELRDASFDAPNELMAAFLGHCARRLEEGW